VLLGRGDLADLHAIDGRGGQLKAYHVIGGD
jgi:hypothetical protein